MRCAELGVEHEPGRSSTLAAVPRIVFICWYDPAKYTVVQFEWSEDEKAFLC